MVARSLFRVALGLSLAGALGIVGPLAVSAAETAGTPQVKAAALPMNRLSIDDGKSWIGVEKFSFQNAAAVAMLGSASHAAGKVARRPVEVTVPIDASTAAFTAELEKNPVCPNVRMSIRSADYAFKNVVFSKVADARGANGLPIRELTFVYQTVTYTITPGGKSATDDWSQ